MTGPELDLFGEALTFPCDRHRVIKRGGKGWKGGYAAAPGSGPAGQTCGTCAHYCSVGGSSRRYPKCGLMRQHWTHGPGSDIKKRMTACSRWEAKAS